MKKLFSFALIFALFIVIGYQISEHSRKEKLSKETKWFYGKGHKNEN